MRGTAGTFGLPSVPWQREDRVIIQIEDQPHVAGDGRGRLAEERRIANRSHQVIRGGEALPVELLDDGGDIGGDAGGRHGEERWPLQRRLKILPGGQTVGGKALGQAGDVGGDRGRRKGEEPGLLERGAKIIPGGQAVGGEPLHDPGDVPRYRGGRQGEERRVYKRRPKAVLDGQALIGEPLRHAGDVTGYRGGRSREERWLFQRRLQVVPGGQAVGGEPLHDPGNVANGRRGRLVKKLGVFHRRPQVSVHGQAVGGEAGDRGLNLGCEIEIAGIPGEVAGAGAGGRAVEELRPGKDLGDGPGFLLLRERQFVQLGADAGQEAVGMRRFVIRQEINTLSIIAAYYCLIAILSQVNSRMNAIPPASCRRGGFNLIALSIIMAAAATVAVSMLPAKDAGDFNTKTIQSIRKLDEVEEKMRSFIVVNGRRPCPADGSLAVNTTNFGKETDTLGDGLCTGALLSGVATNTVGGTIPTKSLNLPDDYAFDAWGRRYTYIVDKRATNTSSCVALGSAGGLTIKDGSGATTDTVMYSYMIHGASGFGAFPAQGSSATGRINTGSADADALTNAGVSTAALTSGTVGFASNSLSYSDTRVKKPKTATFDQITYYRPSMKNTCCIGSPSLCAITSCALTANQGGGSLTNGSSKNAYVSASDASCTAHTLLCTNAVLTCDGCGTLTNCTYSSCGLQCTLPWGGTLASGSTVPAYSEGSDPAACPAANTLSCTNGVLSCSTGSVAANCEYSACAANSSACPLPWGGSIYSGQNATAYQSATVAYGGTCASQSRACTAGTLSGSYAYGNCTVTAASSCTLPWGGTLASGNSVNAYSEGSDASACPAPVSRTCTNGTLSGSGNYETCVVNSGGNGNIWVLDEENYRVQEFTSSGAYLMQFGSYGGGNGQFVNPYLLATDASGNVWVADTGYNRVEEFNSSGTFLLGIGAGYNGVSGSIGSSGSGNGQFVQPTGIAFDSSGNVWVVDYGNNRVQEFNSNGVYQSQFGSGGGSGNGQFYDPTGIAFDASGNIWVTDSVHDRVQKFTGSGAYLSQFGSGGSGNGQFSWPAGIAIDSSGNLWVADMNNNRVQEFNSSGTYVSKFGSAGSGNGQLTNPYGIATDSSGNIWVADQGGNRAQEFNSSGTFQMGIGAGYNGVSGAIGSSGSGQRPVP